ncbi:hypothetical protein AFE02nite_29400 [Actinotalea fermentans]|uniref:Transposase DDE domain-containing protein n=1 Tax=Actinotalea fermentans TaxID=43671 RepID=A0A511Z1G0_9CELL|nr:hypothetical protein AFE02nite_29400 [Actinotalea fermentans]
MQAQSRIMYRLGRSAKWVMLRLSRRSIAGNTDACYANVKSIRMLGRVPWGGTMGRSLRLVIAVGRAE